MSASFGIVPGYGRSSSRLTETHYVHLRTIPYSDWSALFFKKLQDAEQAHLTRCQGAFPFAEGSEASTFQDWFAATNSEVFWGDCGRAETDFEVVRFVFPNRWLAEKFEWRLFGRAKFLDGTLEVAPPEPG